MAYSEEMAEKLNELLEKNHNTERGYKSAINDVKNVELKTLFEEMAQQRYDFGHELKTEIKNFGAAPESGSSTKNDFSRAWMDIKSAMADNKEAVVLKAVESGEEAALEEYNEIIAKSTFPPSTENLLLKQRNAIKSSLGNIKALGESFS